MSDPSAAASDSTIRYRWLKAMYGANVLLSGPIGIGALLAPETLQTLMGLPPQDPIHFGIASGAVPLAFGLAGLWELWSPLRAAPVLLLQAAFKILFLAAVALPLAVGGAFSDFGLPIVVIFVFFVVGNLIALPFHHLFERSP